MEPGKLLDTLAVAERLKDTTRHCYTSKGRHETVADHCWMAMLMAFFMRDEFPEADMDKVMKMCLIHDLGEALTGDIPAFEKTETDAVKEENALLCWVDTLPEMYATQMRALYEEMAESKSLESKIFRAIDGLEAVIQHNLSDLTTWIPAEYELNQTYANDKVAFSAYLTRLRQEILADTRKKLSNADKGEET